MTPTMQYELKQIDTNIWGIFIPNDYDRAMTFCRVQEYYESPNERFRGKYFSFWSYMKWYSESNGNSFTYPSDWTGYNIPLRVLNEWCELLLDYESESYLNPHESILLSLWDQMTLFSGFSLNDYYVIGSDSPSSATTAHELCHAKYAIDSNYRTRVNNFIDRSLNKKKIEFADFKNSFYIALIAEGYPNDDIILRDEFQAHLQDKQIPDNMFKALKKNMGLGADKHLTQLLKRYKKELLAYINE
jgi:hypothetical protein